MQAFKRLSMRSCACLHVYALTVGSIKHAHSLASFSTRSSARSLLPSRSRIYLHLHAVHSRSPSHTRSLARIIARSTTRSLCCCVQAKAQEKVLNVFARSLAHSRPFRAHPLRDTLVRIVGYHTKILESARIHWQKLLYIEHLLSLTRRIAYALSCAFFIHSNYNSKRLKG